jgi:hypothetical protein
MTQREVFVDVRISRKLAANAALGRDRTTAARRVTNAMIFIPIRNSGEIRGW